VDAADQGNRDRQLLTARPVDLFGHTAWPPAARSKGGGAAPAIRGKAVFLGQLNAFGTPYRHYRRSVCRAHGLAGSWFDSATGKALNALLTSREGIATGPAGRYAPPTVYRARLMACCSKSFEIQASPAHLLEQASLTGGQPRWRFWRSTSVFEFQHAAQSALPSPNREWWFLIFWAGGLAHLARAASTFLLAQASTTSLIVSPRVSRSPGDPAMPEGPAAAATTATCRPLATRCSVSRKLFNPISAQESGFRTGPSGALNSAPQQSSGCGLDFVPQPRELGRQARVGPGRPSFLGV